MSQSTIKMEKGYYILSNIYLIPSFLSQSTIKMEKGYYYFFFMANETVITVAIHNKNGKGLLQGKTSLTVFPLHGSQSTIKMEKGYY